MKQVESVILENRPIAESWRELVLEWKAEAPEPGQFLTIRVSPLYDPLLRRPFAFSSFSKDEGRASIIYQIRGKATALLSELGPGATLDTIGPLGKGFPAPKADDRPLLAAGGIGLGPVLFLARRLAEAPSAEPAPFVVGFRTAAAFPELDFPEGTVLCSEDGSGGFHGRPDSWLDALPDPERAGITRTRLYACGPGPMLAALAGLCGRKGWAGSFSAEQWMACGVGACMGCAVERSDGAGYLRACADGPVFEAGEIAWR